MKYNVYSLFNALLPIVIISFFLLDSLFNVNLKGIVLIFGALINILVTIIVGNSFELDEGNTPNEMCTPFTISNIQTFTRLPINKSMLCYVFIYLISIAGINGFLTINLPFIAIMIALIFADSSWLIRNGCFSGKQTFISACSGILFALLWSFIINKTNNKNLLYNIGINDYNVCHVPKRRSYKCKTKNNE